MAYRMYEVKILAKDYDKAQVILLKHDRVGDIDHISTERYVEKINGKNVTIIHYWIQPYIYEDFETIMNEFKQAGIQIM